MKTNLYLDCDGVLADFDWYFFNHFGIWPSNFEDKYGSKKFWKEIANIQDFYYNLPLMPGASVLWDETKKYNPTILTGCPVGEWAAPQKYRWARKHFGDDVKIICCLSRNKSDYILPNKTNILIDDRDHYRDKWENKGGIFIHYKSISSSLKELNKCVLK